MDPVDRGIETVIEQRLTRHKVVVVEGARAVGKTTSAKRIAAALGGTYLDAASELTRSALRSDAHAFLAAATPPVVIDEAQLVDELPLAVKAIADGRHVNGQFLLTGSSRLGRGAVGGSDPLAGRSTRVTMYPLTVGERQGVSINHLDGWLRGEIAAGIAAELAHDELLAIPAQGGLPGSVLTQGAELSPDDWWGLAREAMPTYLESALSLIYGKYDADRHRLVTAIRYLAANPAQILNISRMANELALSRDTARRYVELLADSLLIHRLPSLRPSAHKTIAAHPKLAIFDTAFASWATDVAPANLLGHAAVWGGLIENLVAIEVLAQASWVGAGVMVGHWRQGTDQVDLVVQGVGGSIIGIEVKAARSVSSADAAGLRALRRRVGDRLTLGVVLYTGAARFPLDDDDDRMWAAPLTDLWTTVS